MCDVSLTSETGTGPAFKSEAKARHGNSDTVERYRTFLGRTFDHLSKVYGITLKMPVTLFENVSCCDAVKEVKTVLSGPLDQFLVSGKISGSMPLDGLSRRERIGLLCSLNSFKKGLPEPCACSLSKLEKEFIEESAAIRSCERLPEVCEKNDQVNL